MAAVPATEHYDFVVIGAGPAGEKAAAQASYWGKRVVVVEREAVPGGAMAVSAIAAKTLREAALYLTGFRQRDVYGVGLELSAEEAVQRLQARTARVVDTMTSAVVANFERHGIEVVHGTARLGADGHTVFVGDRVLSGDVVLIATGSRPFHPPGIDFDDPDIHDSEEARVLDRPMRNLVVIGGGAVGCEYASIFTALGGDVTLVDSGQRLLPFMDTEISDALAAIFRSLGMTVLQGVGHPTVERDAEGVRVALDDGTVLRPEKVVFAAGRSGNTDDLGLGDAGVEMDARGRVVVDERYQTNVAGVYAAGDVIGPPALASVSMEQGRVAACFAFDIPFKKTVDPLAPFGVYSVPEVAMVGHTSASAAAAGLDCEAGVATFAGNARAAIHGSTDGMVKLVFTRDDAKLVGVHVLGESATELVHQGQAVISFGGTVDWFIHSTFNVPTLSEAFKYAAYDGLRRVGR
ncbi:MAG: transhydrogenase [Actinomycetota bacterium]|jgi:NAD(P) transhydrogenase